MHMFFMYTLDNIREICYLKFLLTTPIPISLCILFYLFQDTKGTQIYGRRVIFHQCYISFAWANCWHVPVLFAYTTGLKKCPH